MTGRAALRAQMPVRTLASLSDDDLRALTRRSAVPDPAVMAAAAEIVATIARGGDAALREAGERHGGGRFEALVPAAERAAALAAVDTDLRRSLESSIDAVRRHHTPQRPVDRGHETAPGVRIDRRWAPVQRVAAYVPGGKAAYPSSLIMTVVPAQVAGVDEVVVASPAAADGTIDQAVLATAALLGVTEVYAMGGAQAVAALAYGTETIEPVDLIVGPGSAWVTAAKLEVVGTCAIDMPAGPSEVLVLADHTAEPRLVAIDLLCQAEHGPDSPALLVTTDPDLPDRVAEAISDLLDDLPRRELLAAALAHHGQVLVAANLDEGLAFTNAYASEHVTVMTDRPGAVAERIVRAGSIYVGRWSPESAGDYATGANHVLPTGGLARAYGPLGVEDFGSWRQVQTLTEPGLDGIRATIETLATAEGLDAHRLAAALRFDDGRGGPPS